MKMMSLNIQPTSPTRQVTRSLIGKFIHTFEDGEVSKQGVILGRPTPGMYLVQFFEWLSGGNGEQLLVPIEDMEGWRFLKR